MTRIDLVASTRYLMWAGAILSDLLGIVARGSISGLRLARVDLAVSCGVAEIAKGQRAGRSDVVTLGLLRGFTRSALGILETLPLPEQREKLLRLKAAFQLAACDEPTIDTVSLIEPLRVEMSRAEVCHG